MSHVGGLNLACSSSTNGHVVAVGTHVVDSTINGGVQGAQLSVEGEDRLVRGAEGEVHVGAAGNDVDVLLSAISVHEVQVVAALCGLQVYINSGSEVGLGCTVVAAHHAGEVVGLVLCGLIQAQLVCNANLRIGGVSAECTGGNVGSIAAHIAASLAGQDELSDELRHAHVGSIAIGDVVGAGGGDGVVITVSTQEILGAAQLHSINLAGGLVSPVDAGRSYQCGTCTQVAILVGVAFQLNIGLGLAVHEVEANTLALGPLNVHLHSVVDVLRGSQVVAVLLAVEEQDLAQGNLLHLQDVGSLSLQGAQVNGGDTAAHGPAVQSTTAAEFQLAVVVLDHTGNGNLIGDADLISAVALQTVALDLGAVDLDSDGHVAIARIVCLVNRNDLTGQGCLVGQLLAGLQISSISQDLIGIRGGTLRHTAAADAVDQLTAGVELDLAIVVLDDTSDSNLIVDSDLADINALHTEGDHGVLAIAIRNDDNRDVTIGRIVGRIDGSNSTGHGNGVRQRLAASQSVGGLQDCADVVGSVNSVAFLDSIQSTTGVELDLAVVVLQSTGDGNDVTNSQLVSAFALQTVALDGHVLNAFNSDGDSDVLVLSAVNSVDGDDLTAQSGLVRQALASSQLVSSLDNFGHVCSSRQQHIPGVGSGTALLVGDGSSQGIRSSDLTGFVDVDGDRTIFIDNDLDQILTDVNSPDDSERNAGDTDDTVPVIVHGSRSGLFCVLVNCAQISHCLFSCGALGLSRLSRLGRGSLRLGGVLNGGSLRSLLFAASQQAQQHDSYKKKR